MKTGDQLGFGFRKIERCAIAFRQSRDEQNAKSDEVERKIAPDKPLMNAAGLRQADGLKTKRTDLHDDHEDRQGGGDLITHDLRRSPYAAEQRPLVVRSPARQQDRNDGERSDRNHKENADVEISEH